MPIERIDAPADVRIPAVADLDAIVLPREIDEGEGLYDDTVVTFVKELREAGASADFQHGAESRAWISENALDQIALALIIGIASNAGWDALCTALRRRKGSRVRVRMAKQDHGGPDPQWEWFEADGDGEAVAEAINAWAFQENREPEDVEES